MIGFPMQIIRHVLLGIFLVYCFVGCATPLAELRTKQPTQIGYVESRYLSIAGCVTDALETADSGSLTSLVYRLLDRIPGKTASVTGSVVGVFLVPTSIVLEISFTQDTEQMVRIETRNADGPGGWGYLGGKIGERMWPYAERCAGRPITISAP
jgi:hypothetical protein